MPTDPTRSLMDDSEFLAELEKLERVAPRERTSDPAFDAGLKGLDDGLHHNAAEAPRGDWPQSPAYNDEKLIRPQGPSAGRVALAVGGFLLMMALGAGAAAYVFRDRLALILR
jgi:hypothetical protein